MKKIWIDIETTGTDPVKNGIVQIAAIIEPGDGVPLVEWQSYCKPFHADMVEAEAMEVNGKTLIQVMSFAEPKIVHKQLLTLLGQYVDRYDKTDKFIFCGYNAMFDMNFLREWFRKCGDNFFGSWFWFPPLDTMGYAMRLLAGQRHELPDFKLGTVAKYLGIDLEGRDLHDAMTDIQITMEIEEMLHKIYEGYTVARNLMQEESL